MSRFFSYLTVVAVAAGILSTSSLAHAKGSGHSTPHNSTHMSSQSHSQNHSVHAHQHPSKSHEHSDRHPSSGDDSGKHGNPRSGQQFSPGGVPFGQGPAGTPSNPIQVTQVRDHRGTSITPITTIAGSGADVRDHRGTSITPITTIASTGADVRDHRGNAANTFGGTAKGHRKPPAGGRQTSIWDAAGEAVQGLGDALGGLFDPGFTGPPIKQTK